MDTALNPKQSDPRHALVARADEGLAHAYEQITRAGEEIARAEEQLSRLEHNGARRTVQRKRPWYRGPAVRGFTGLLLAACIGAAAIAWQSPYGDTAKEMIARWTAQGVVTSLPPESPELSAQPNPPALEATAARTASEQPAPPAPTAAEDVAPTALSPELTQLLQSMTRDLATLGQAIEQLRASQAQLARDNANTAQQLRASQEQIARVTARTSEASGQNLRARISAPSPRPTASPTRKPVPTH